MTDYKLSEGAQAIVRFLQENDSDGDNMFTFRDIANGIGRQPRSVSATITSLVKKGIAVRAVVGENKYIHLTEDGLSIDFENQEG